MNWHLSSSALLDLEIINVKVKKVLTIENLTTFVSFDNSDYVVIFLAGFHNSVKRALLRKLNEHNKSIEFSFILVILMQVDYLFLMI